MMRKNNLEKQEHTESRLSKTNLVQDKESPLKVRVARTRYAVLIATLMGALFGGSCDGCNCSATWKGSEVAGCSCVDTGDSANKALGQKQKKEKLDY
ncbi:hypothetical protein J7J83_00540 [bacterium]|nr:hypothetical protein [bacterium]